PRPWPSPKKGTSSLNRDDTARSFRRRRPTTASQLSQKSNRAAKMRSVPTERPKTIENAIAGDPFVLAPLRLHYLRWVLFNIGSDTYFMYQGIFDTDFDKYTEDAIALFKKTGVDTVFENLEGFPADWKTNTPAFTKFVREHQCPSFLEYGEYPFVSADEIKKALKLKATFSTMLDQMQ